VKSKQPVSFPSSNRGELALLRQIRSRVAQAPGGGLRLGIGDDCALIRLRPREELAVTTDLSIAGRHFRLDWHPPESVGHRALARGLSDLAAMGARPVAAFLSLGLPAELTLASGRKQSWIARFYNGLLALANSHRTPLAGGDLAESPVPMADILLLGAVPLGKALLRSTAQPGDLLYVTGTLGGSAAGLAHLAELATTTTQRANQQPPKIPQKRAPQLAAHLYPQPRVSQGLLLRRRGLATAAIDISDGLSTDLAHLCDESVVAAEIDSARLPIHPGASQWQALHGGEDYELLFTAPEFIRMPRSIAGVPITCIGRIVRPRRGHPRITLLTAQGSKPLVPRGWEHFD